MPLFKLFRRAPLEREAFSLYSESVAAARRPWFYAALGVPDTLDGRFDLINLHMALLVRRLRRDDDPRGAALAQGVFDAMFSDMDQSLREMGVSDLAVGKRMKRMWEAFHGRAVAYEAALDSGDAGELALALARNVWRGEAPGLVDDQAAAPAQALAGHVLRQSAHLLDQPLAALLAGRVAYLPPPESPHG